MKLVVMQPYFLPYLGYFDLLNITDEWIVFDTPQYMRHGWINRNRVLHPQEGWQYIGVSLKKHARNTPLNRVEVADPDWGDMILRKLVHYKKEAPYYRQTIAFFEDCFGRLRPVRNLSQINTDLFIRVARLLGIDRPITIFSELNLTLPGPVKGPGDWGLRVAQAVGASEYINRPGGADLFDARKFEEHGIKLTFQDYKTMIYSCGMRAFVSDLSIVDVMMWNSCATIKRYLDTFRSTNPSNGDQ
jgi:hypothetical protein